MGKFVGGGCLFASFSTLERSAFLRPLRGTSATLRDVERPLAARLCRFHKAKRLKEPQGRKKVSIKLRMMILIMNMKQILITMLLLLGAISISAQSSAELSKQEQYKSEVRQTLNLDYSMPDYHTGKIDPKVIGPRLALLLEELCSKYKESVNNSYLSTIQCQQIEGLDYCTIKEMKLEDVSKTGNTITIRFKTTLNKNPLNIKKSDLTVSLVDGVSESKYANSLFMTINKYLKE